MRLLMLVVACAVGGCAAIHADKIANQAKPPRVLGDMAEHCTDAGEVLSDLALTLLPIMFAIRSARGERQGWPGSATQPTAVLTACAEEP